MKQRHRLPPRRQWVELEDLEYFPQVLRDGITAYLQHFDVYQPVAPMVAELLRGSGLSKVVDLCSGGGGPWVRLKPEVERILGAPLSLLLTDKFPNAQSLERATTLIGSNDADWSRSSVDATQMGRDMVGVRTMFTAVHHFRPEIVQAILKNAQDTRAPIGIFDFSNRRNAMRSLWRAGYDVFRTMGKVAPRRWSHLALTYCLPVLPIAVTWDAFVSDCRAYEPSDYEEMTLPLKRADWRWDTGRLSGSDISYLLGQPRGIS